MGSSRPNHPFRYKDVAIAVTAILVFVVGSAAAGASEFQAAKGGSWAHAFRQNLGPMALLAAPVLAVLIFASRRQPDGMPRELWRQRTSSRPETEVYAMTKWYRFATVGFVGLSVVLSPLFAYAALRDGPGATVFVAVWIVLVLFGARYRLTCEPELLTLSCEDVLHAEGNRLGGCTWDIPVSSIEEISWPTMGGYVTLTHARTKMPIAKYVRGLDRLVVELRRRNPAIVFSGPWPPRGYWRR